MLKTWDPVRPRPGGFELSRARCGGVCGGVTSEEFLRVARNRTRLVLDTGGAMKT